MKVERVVLNALAEECGCAAGYLRLRRFLCHRLRSRNGGETTAGLSTRSTRAVANQNAAIKVLRFQGILCIHDIDF
jgi:hypothetical protein